MPTSSARVRVLAQSIYMPIIPIFCVFSIRNGKMPTRKIRIKTLSLGVVIPDITFHLAKENAQMALFSPYDVERVYGKPFADIAISEHYAELVANERIRKKYLNARDFFQRLAEIQFESGYPYIMYEDTVNRANPIAGRINMSNLCSEILQVNSASEYDENLDYARTGHDISCNLGSLNIAHTMDSPDFARTVETAARFNGSIRYESYPQRAVHRSRKCRLARHRTGADEFTRLSGARRHRLWIAGSTGFHQSLFLYHHGTHCVPRCCWRANAVKPSPGSNSHAMPMVNISANICKGTGSRKRRKLANCLPVAVLRYLPVRCGRSCATT